MKNVPIGEKFPQGSQKPKEETYECWAIVDKKGGIKTATHWEKRADVALQLSLSASPESYLLNECLKKVRITILEGE
jgi:hypothetical protein